MSEKSSQSKWEFNLGSVEDFKELSASFNARIDIAEDVSILANPVEAGGLVIPNSLAVHPMEGCDGDSQGRPGDLTRRRYDRFVRGGAGLIWAEAIAVVPEARANPRQLWLHEGSRDAFASMVTDMRDAAKESMGPEHKPVIVAQLTHSGRYSKPRGISEPIIPQRDPYRDPLVPEAVPSLDRASRIAADHTLITDEQLDELQNSYVNAARLAFEAGFDAVDIKSCHGYLINELLASRNREGKYGGSFENRTRFVLEVIEKIHKELGKDKQVVTRLGFYDAIPYPYGWGVDEKDHTREDLTEPKKLVKLLMQRGVRLINFTIANPYYNPHVGRPFNQAIVGAYNEPEHPLKGVKRLIDIAGDVQREFGDLALVGTGYSWLRHLMGNVGAAAKSKGLITIVGGGRMSFAYPDFAKDLLTKGTLDKNKVCVGCSACTQLMRYGQVTGCVVRDNKVYGPIFEHGRMSDKDNLQRLAQSCLECQEPTCQLACPAGIDIPDFIHKFLDGREREAYETIRKANIFPEVCAWLCPVEQQCQGNCLQKFIGDAPLPIADIQRYLAEKANRAGWSKLRIPERATGKKISIIGAGPAGLSAAAVLLEAGHSVTILDRHTEFGGMVESVIPPQRQRTALKNEIEAVFSDVPKEKLLVRSGIELSGKYDLDAIENEGFDAVFIGMGLPEAIKTSDENLDGQYNALEFLSLAKQGLDIDLSGKRVAVIGGGNTAMDAAVTAGHLGAEDVYLIYRRSFAEMPAWSAERDKAVEAGVHFVILTQQLSYLSQDGRVTGIKLCPCQLGDKDKSGRRSPLPLPDSSYTLDFDIVVEAIGQRSSGSLADMLPNVEIEDGLIKTKPNSRATSRDNVFAGGDIVRGPSTVVAAIADGMKAAREINKLLTDDRSK